MTKDDIIRMAKEAMGHTSIEPNDKVTFYVSYNNGIDADGFCDSVETFIERFSALVAAEEREACAVLCDQISDEDGFEGGYADRCAIAIRERGQ